MATIQALGGAGLPVLLQQLLGYDVATALTATGTTRTDAYALTASLSVFGTVASGTGAVLPAITSAGNPQYQQFWLVKNDGANDLKVYASGSDTISGTAGSTGVTVVSAEGALFAQVSGTAWIVFPMGT